ncbi:MAG TPA: hypothetical protein VLA88_04770 [Candidatus Saccharimonadales bacterium]|nr:hypothetical protein [Candidatus Saccharimonadales bacterium]
MGTNETVVSLAGHRKGGPGQTTGTLYRSTGTSAQPIGGNTQHNNGFPINSNPIPNSGAVPSRLIDLELGASLRPDLIDDPSWRLSTLTALTQAYFKLGGARTNSGIPGHVFDDVRIEMVVDFYPGSVLIGRVQVAFPDYLPPVVENLIREFMKPLGVIECFTRPGGVLLMATAPQ